MIDAVALAAWAGLILAAHVWGERLVHRIPQTSIFAAPLVARFDPRVSWVVLLPIGVAAVAVLLCPRLVVRLSWGRLLVLAFVLMLAWAVSLALVGGVSELTRPVRLPNDYLRDVPLVGAPGVFLSHFVERIGSYHQHVRAHPPGMVMVLWAMDRLGLGGPGWEAALEILGGAAMVPAVLVSLREVAGERWARSATPFVALAPAAVWIATSADALFAGVTAWAITLLLLSIRRRGPRSDALAAGGGVLFGAGMFLTYGSAVLMVIPLIMVVRERRVRPLVMGALGVGVVVLAFGAARFWWLSGLRASVGQYRASVARLRPQGYFWFGNLAAFAIVLGPATAVGLARLRDRRTWLLVAGGLAAMALADATGLSKAEVERIWLPFAPWILLAGSALVPRPAAMATAVSAHSAAGMRRWLALTLATGLALQVLLKTTW